MTHGANELQREKRRQQRIWSEMNVKKYVHDRKFPVCGHRGRIGDAKAGICFMCRVAERRFTPAEIQAEMGFNTEPITHN